MQLALVPDWKPSKGTRIAVGIGMGAISIFTAWFAYRMFRG